MNLRRCPRTLQCPLPSAGLYTELKGTEQRGRYDERVFRCGDAGQWLDPGVKQDWVSNC